MDKRLTGVLSDVFRLPAATIQPELTRAEVGSWDSLKQMDLVLSLENSFDVSLGIPDIKRLVSVADIIAVLREKGVSLED